MKYSDVRSDNKVLRTIRFASVVMLLGSFIRVFLFNDNDWFVALIVAMMCIGGLPTRVNSNNDDYEN